MNSPKTHKKTAKRRALLARASTAKEAIGRIQKGTDTFILTFGQFSLIDALVHILDQTGPANVDLSTWTAADAHLERSAELIESAAIKRFRMIVDRSFETRQPDYCAHMRKLFGAESLRAIRTHAKFLTVRSSSFDIVVRTSMNLNENPRLENIEISEDAKFADFFERIVDEVFAEVDENQNRSAMLDLGNLPDSYPFREIQADQIPRETLNEPQTTHTIKKL